MMKKKNKKGQHLADFESSLIPLMDVIFILVFFLMIGMIRMAPQAYLDINLPDLTQKTGIQKDEQAVCEFAIDGTIFTGERTFSSLKEFENAAWNAPDTIDVKADGELEYKQVSELISILSEKGVEKVTLVGLGK